MIKNLASTFGRSMKNGEFGTDWRGRNYVIRAKKGGMGKLERFYIGTRKGANTDFAMWGELIVRQPGPGACMVKGCGCGQFHFVARNKIVGQGLRHMQNLSFLGTNTSNASGQLAGPPFETNVLTNSYIRVGTGSGATTDSTTGLVAQVATNPSSTSFSAPTNPSAGVYRTSFTATWNAGAITGASVNEFGIFGKLNHVLNTQQTVTAGGGNGTALTMYARLSVTDAEFVNFTIDTAKPLVVEHRVTWTFT